MLRDRIVGLPQHDAQRLILKPRGLGGRQRRVAAQRIEPRDERIVAPRAAEQIAVAQPHVGIGVGRMRGDPVVQRREAALGLARIDPLRADRGKQAGIVRCLPLRTLERRGERRAVAARERVACIGQRAFRVELARERAHAVRALRLVDAGEHGLRAVDIVERMAVQRARVAHLGRIAIREPFVHHRAAKLRQSHVAIQAREREARPGRVGRRAHGRFVALRGRPAFAARRERARLAGQQVRAQAVERAPIVAARHAALQRIEQRPDALRAAGVFVERRGVAHGRDARRRRGQQFAQQRLRARPVALGQQRIGKLQLRIRAVRLHRERGARRTLRLRRATGRRRRAALREQPPELRGAREALPLAALIGRERCGACEQRARFVVPPFAQPQQPEAADRVRIVGTRTHRARQERLGRREIAARERLQAALLRDVVGIAFEPPPRVALPVELGRAIAELGIVRHEREIGMQRVEIGGIGAGRLQHVPPQRHRVGMVGVGARRERPRDTVGFGARVVALVQQPRERERRIGVMRIGRERATQRGDRRRTAARRVRDDLVVLGAERTGRRTVRKQRDDPSGRFVGPAATREQPDLRHLAAAARRDAQFVGGAPRIGRVGCARLQPGERGLRALRVAEPQQHAHLFGEQRGIVGRDQQPLVQRVAREVVSMLDAPHPRGREQPARIDRVGRCGRRARGFRARGSRRGRGWRCSGRRRGRRRRGRRRCGKRRRSDRRRERRDARDDANQRATHERSPQRTSSEPSAPNR
ncbi:hypothetical protein FEP67_06329 [Burkholderia multivorans]|nr:hypothetical protein [Burkholderia multivorans]